MVKFHFCDACFSHAEVIEEVRGRGKVLSQCMVCHSLDVRALSADDDVLRKTLRALIRLYFSEFEYNEHVGGESLAYLLFGQNKIFAIDANTADEGEFESGISIIEEDWYPKHDAEVSLGGGYWDGRFLFSPYDWLDGDISKVFEESL